MNIDQFKMENILLLQMHNERKLVSTTSVQKTIKWSSEDENSNCKFVLLLNLFDLVIDITEVPNEIFRIKFNSI